MAIGRLWMTSLALVLITTGCGSDRGSANQDGGPVVGTPTKAQAAALLKRDFAAYNDRQWAALQANACPSSPRSKQVQAVQRDEEGGGGLHFTYSPDTLKFTSDVASLGNDKYEVKFGIDYRRKGKGGTEKTGTEKYDAKLAKNSGGALCIDAYV